MTYGRRTHLKATATLAAAVGALAFGGGAVAAATSSAQTATTHSNTQIPPIHETFTHQDCPAHPSTTVALENCAGDTVLASDTRIDRLDSAILAALPASGQRTFASAAHEWLTYRNTVARAAASTESGGSAAPLAALGAMATENTAHIGALSREFTSASGQRP